MGGASHSSSITLSRGGKSSSPVGDVATLLICIARLKTSSLKIRTSQSLRWHLYEPRHFVELVERYGIRWHEKTLGQLFCDGSARAILDMLLAECERACEMHGGVELVLNARGITVEGGSGDFRVECSAGKFRAGALVVAAGGLSIPKLGATGLGYDLAQQFGLKVVPPRPALGAPGAGWSGDRLDGVGRRCVGSNSRGRRSEVSRKDAGDAPRTERAGGAASFELLESGRASAGGLFA